MRFYEKLFKPIPFSFFIVGLIFFNPLHIPPDDEARADTIIVSSEEIEKPSLAVPRTPEDAKRYAKNLMSQWGWESKTQWQCLELLWTRESNWRPDAYNRKPVWQNGEKLNAGGIPQILGLDPDISVENQIERGFIYIEKRYFNPCSAWRFWSAEGWY